MAAGVNLSFKKGTSNPESERERYSTGRFRVSDEQKLLITTN